MSTTYRVNAQVISLLKPQILLPERGRCRAWVPCHEERDSETNREKTKSHPSPCCRRDCVVNNTSKKLTANIADIEYSVGWPAKKTNNILVSIDGGSGIHITPHHKEQGHPVDSRIDCIEQVVSKVRAKDRGNQEGYDHAHGRDVYTVPVSCKLSIHDHSDERILQGESRAEAENHDGEEEQKRPELCARHLSDTSWVREERDGKAADWVISGLRKLLEKADNTENGEAPHDLVE